MVQYDQIGLTYNTYRNADPRVVSTLAGSLSLPRGSVIADIGAGTGNYANSFAELGYQIIAIEPSDEMRRQAILTPGVSWLSGKAESMPLDNGAVDGVVVILAVHHFDDLTAAGSEMQRICPNGPIAILTLDPRRSVDYWFKIYFPEIYGRLFNTFPPLEQLGSLLRFTSQWSCKLTPFPLPRDLTDLNMHAGWARPEIYLSEDVRRGMSGFALADTDDVAARIDRLKADLTSGAWDRRHGAIRTLQELDVGFAKVVFKRNSIAAIPK